MSIKNIKKNSQTRITRDSEKINYMFEFEERYLHNASFFSLQVIQPHSSENETFYAMDTYSMGNYEEGFYESAFTDHSWSTKEGEGGLDDYFEGDIKVSDLVSKAMNK